MFIKNILFCFFSFLALMGCASEDSDTIETSAIFATYSVNATGSVSAQFNVGNSLGTFLELSDGDTVTVNGLALAKVEVGNFIQYTGSISVAAGDTITFVLSREGEGAHQSTVTMPQEISVTSPADGSSHTAGDQLVINWAAGDASDTVTAVLNKTPSDETDQSRSTADSNGTVVFTTTETEKVSSGSIAARLQLTRSHTGSIATTHKGRITASQISEEVEVSLN